MPELPEVETTRRGIAPLCGETVAAVIVRDARLRWPVPRSLPRTLIGQRLARVDRRAKYLLLWFDRGCLVLHLGMSGSLRIVDSTHTAGPHDHVDLVFGDGRCLRLRDPRRFGSLHWTTAPPEQHPLLAGLGPEPLSPEFDGAYLHLRARARTTSIKQFIMDGHVVVGVGNIYASEALHAAGIHPARSAGRISRERLVVLALAIRRTLENAIKSGGTSLRDFVGGDGSPGYFRQKLRVYQREGKSCSCGRGVIRSLRLGQRTTFYCPACQH